MKSRPVRRELEQAPAQVRLQRRELRRVAIDCPIETQRRELGGRQRGEEVVGVRGQRLPFDSGVAIDVEPLAPGPGFDHAPRDLYRLSEGVGRIVGGDPGTEDAGDERLRRQLEGRLPVYERTLEICACEL